MLPVGTSGYSRLSVIAAMTQPGILHQRLHRFCLPHRRVQFREKHGISSRDFVRHLRDIDEITIFESRCIELSAADKPDIASAGSQCSRDRCIALDIIEHRAGDHNVASSCQWFCANRFPRAPAHNDGGAQSQPLKSFQVGRIVPGQFSIYPNDTVLSDCHNCCAQCQPLT